MVQEGILTIGAVSGIFTALLMNSFKNNIIDPVVEKVAPLDKLLDFVDDGKLNNSNKKTTPQSQGQTPQGQTPQGQQPKPQLSASIMQHGNQFGGQDKDKIRWKVFLRDLVTWVIIIFVLYQVWKRVIQPIRMKAGQPGLQPGGIQPGIQTALQSGILPMGIGRVKR